MTSGERGRFKPFEDGFSFFHMNGLNLKEGLPEFSFRIALFLPSMLNYHAAWQSSALEVGGVFLRSVAPNAVRSRVGSM